MDATTSNISEDSYIPPTKNSSYILQEKKIIKSKKQQSINQLKKTLADPTLQDPSNLLATIVPRCIVDYDSFKQIKNTLADNLHHSSQKLKKSFKIKKLQPSKDQHGNVSNLGEYHQFENTCHIHNNTPYHGNLSSSQPQLAEPTIKTAESSIEPAVPPKMLPTQSNTESIKDINFMNGYITKIITGETFQAANPTSKPIISHTIHNAPNSIKQQNYQVKRYRNNSPQQLYNDKLFKNSIQNTKLKQNQRKSMSQQNLNLAINVEHPTSDSCHEDRDGVENIDSELDLERLNTGIYNTLPVNCNSTTANNYYTIPRSKTGETENCTPPLFRKIKSSTARSFKDINQSNKTQSTMINSTLHQTMKKAKSEIASIDQNLAYKMRDTNTGFSDLDLNSNHSIVKIGNRIISKSNHIELDKKTFEDANQHRYAWMKNFCVGMFKLLSLTAVILLLIISTTYLVKVLQNKHTNPTNNHHDFDIIQDDFALSKNQVNIGFFENAIEDILEEDQQKLLEKISQKSFNEKGSIGGSAGGLGGGSWQDGNKSTIRIKRSTTAPLKVSPCKNNQFKINSQECQKYLTCKDIKTQVKIDYNNLIGQGMSKKVYLAEYHGQNVVVSIRNKLFKNRYDNFKENIKNLKDLQESQVGVPDSERNIVTFLGSCNDKILVTEYLPHGNLQELIEDSENYDMQMPDIISRLNLLLSYVKNLKFLHTTDSQGPRINCDTNSIAGTTKQFLLNSDKSGLIMTDLDDIPVISEPNAKVSCKYGEFLYNRQDILDQKFLAPEQMKFSGLDGNTNGQGEEKNANYPKIDEKSDIYKIADIAANIILGNNYNYEFGNQLVDLEGEEEDQQKQHQEQEEEKTWEKSIHQKIAKQLLYNSDNKLAEILKACRNELPENRPDIQTVVDVVNHTLEELNSQLENSNSNTLNNENSIYLKAVSEFEQL